MNELIGVADGLSGFPSPKREALLFDRIAIFRLQDYIQSLYERPLYAEPLLAAEFEWLCEQGVIFETTIARDSMLEADEDYRQTFLSALDNRDRYNSLVFPLFAKCDGKFSPLSHEDASLMLALHNEAASLRTRLASFHVVASMRCEAYSLWPIPERKRKLNLPLEHADVIRLVLSSFPFPDDSTSWENVIEFRDNPDNKTRRTALRRWMRKIARAEVTLNEARLELEDLLNQYEEAMRIYRIKYVHGLLETTLTATAEMLEDLVKVKWAKMVKAPFELRRGHVNLLEAELKAPGREVSYVTKAKAEFNSKSLPHS